MVGGKTGKTGAMKESDGQSKSGEALLSPFSRQWRTSVLKTVPRLLQES